MKKVVLMLTVLAVWAFSSPLVAQEPEREPNVKNQERGEMQGRGPEADAGRLEGLIVNMLSRPEALKKFNISEEQAKQLKDSMFAMRKEQIALSKDMEIAALEQARLMTEDPINEKALMKAVEITGDLRTDMAKLHVKQILLVRSILTAEQLKAIRERIQARMSQCPEGGGEGRPGPEARREEWQKHREARREHQGGEAKERGENRHDVPSPEPAAAQE